MNFIEDSSDRIKDVNVITHQLRDVSENAVVLTDDILLNRFETDAYVDTTVIDVGR